MVSHTSMISVTMKAPFAMKIAHYRIFPPETKVTLVLIQTYKLMTPAQNLKQSYLMAKILPPQIRNIA